MKDSDVQANLFAFFKRALHLCFCGLLSLFLIACGGKTSDSGFPEQVAITPTQGSIQGQIDLPSDLSDENISFSRSKLRRSISDYSGFTVLAHYEDDLGRTREISGSIFPPTNSDPAMYFVPGVPFGKEITITVNRGLLSIKATVSPLSAALNTKQQDVDPGTTAETLLYQQIRLKKTGTSFETEKASQTFLEEAQILREIIEREMANENVSSNSQNILDRPLIRDEAVRVADALVSNQGLDNHLPFMVIDGLNQQQRGSITLSFRLFDAEADLASLQFFYSLDGQSFFSATLGEGGLTQVGSLPTARRDGISYSIIWESAADLGVGSLTTAQAAFDIFPAGESSTAQNTARFSTVFFDVDNRGLPSISSLGSSSHLLGQSSSLSIQGANLTVVNQVSLQYFGSETFVSPRRFDLPLGSFSVNSSQNLVLTIPAFGLFPVPYNIVLSGIQVGDTSVSSQEIQVSEIAGPDFALLDPLLSPSTGFNHLTQTLSFTGRNLMGVFGPRARIQLSSDPGVEHVLTPLGAEVLNSGSGEVRWTGVVPSRIKTGPYKVLVQNTCDPLTPCGASVEVSILGGSAELYTVQETSPIISSILPAFGGDVFNTQPQEIRVQGERLFSVFRARISTLRSSLLNSFASQTPLTVTSTSFLSATVVFPRGGLPGTYYLGVENQGGVAVSSPNQTFLAREGIIPATAVALKLFDSSNIEILSGEVSNTTSFLLEISAESLSSLHTVRLLNLDLSGVVIDLAPFETRFDTAKVTIPKHQAPGRYRLDLFNSAGITAIHCGGSCFKITEALPVLSSVVNELRPQDLSERQILAGDAGLLKIQGENLAGVTGAELCTSVAFCRFPIPSVSGSFNEVVANLSSQTYMSPGTYFIKLTNEAGSTFTTAGQNLTILERTPVVEFITPQTLTSAELIDGSHTVRFLGRNLLGVRDVYLLPEGDASPCSLAVTATPYHFLGTEVQGVSRTEATLSLNQFGALLPGTYAFRVRNLTPSGTDDLSFCDDTVHRFTVTEPPLEFLNFFNSSPNSAESTSSFNHLTSQISFVGNFLSGLNRVVLQRRGAPIENLDSELDLQVTTALLTQASFQIPAGLLPGTWDLLLQNSGMSVPALAGASVEILEALTPVISTVNRLGANQENTADIFFDFSGTALEGIGLFTQDVTLVDTRDPSHRVPVPTSSAGGLIDLMALPDGLSFTRIKIPAGTIGGEYYLSVVNSSGKTSSVTGTALVTIFEPTAVFQSQSVIGPFDQSFGFGENNKLTRLELRGLNLGSSDEVLLTRKPVFSGDSVVTIHLQTPVLKRNFDSTDVVLVTTLGKFFRPGFYDVQVRNNSGGFSELIDPISSPFFQQVFVREGAPVMELVGCLDFDLIALPDPSSVNAQCATSFTTRNVNALKNFKFTGFNLFTLNQVSFYPEGSKNAEFSFAVPVLGQSLAGTGVLTHTSRTVELVLPQLLKHIGFYDVELKNDISTVRFKRKLQSAELFSATIFSLLPSASLNNADTLIALSGNHLTGTTSISLFTSDLPDAAAVELKEFEFQPNQITPLSLLSFTVPENINPGSYRIRSMNSLGFNPGDPVNDNNIFTISEPPPVITALSSLWVNNDTTRSLVLEGDGFLGITEVKLMPSVSGDAGTSNGEMSIIHSEIPLQFSITSRSLLSVNIPPFQLPGYYQFSLKNSQTTSYLHPNPIQIRELAPIILSLSPGTLFYAQDEEIIVTGANFLGVRATSVSSTYARLIHAETQTQRDLALSADPGFNELRLIVPRNLLIGDWDLEIKNQVGVASTLTVTRLLIKEGLVELTQASPLSFAYDDDFLQDASKRIDLFGKHLQGLKSMFLSTSIQGREYRYDFLLGTPDPYTSVTGNIINTDFVYPGTYRLTVENSAGSATFATAFDFTIPPSTITDFQPQSGPQNAPTSITFTGTNLRRFETFIFERGIPAAAPDDVDNSLDMIFISTNSDPQVFQEVSHTQAKVLLRSQTPSGHFGDPSTVNQFFTIRWKTFGDPALQELVLATPNAGRYQVSGNVPEILLYKDQAGTLLSATTDFSDYQAGDPAIATTSIFSGLPLDLRIEGEHFGSLQTIKLVRDSTSWTLACTSGTGSASLNQGNLTTVTVRVPRELFHFPANNAGIACSNDLNQLPLAPGVYAFVLEGTSGQSSPLLKERHFYFSESFPDNVTVIPTNSGTLYNDESQELTIQANQLLGTRQVRIGGVTGLGETLLAVEKTSITSETEFKITVDAGVLRGIRDENLGLYEVDVQNSRGWTQAGTGQFLLREKAPGLVSILPTQGFNSSTTPLILNGSGLLGVGQLRPGNVPNRLRIFHLGSSQNPLQTTQSADLTASVTVQDLTSLVAVIPEHLRPGSWFFSIENDHHLSSANPIVFENIFFESLASTPVVTAMTPVQSEFDTLPTTLFLQGTHLSDVLSASLTLVSDVAENIVTLSLLGSPDITGAQFYSARFLLPQSPSFLIPGSYDITLVNSLGSFTLPNFSLKIDERTPILDEMIPRSHPSFENSEIVSFDLHGKNLFGLPTVSVHRGSTTQTLSLTGVAQSRSELLGLTLPASLFPDLWTLSFSNSQGSTSLSFVVTEPVPEIDQVVPGSVSFKERTLVRLSGDHFIGASTAPGSLILTDELKTPLEEVRLIDRYNLEAWVPQGVNVGRFQLLLSNKTGKNSTSDFLTVTGSGLSLDSINPAAGAQAGGDFVNVHGAGFVDGTRLVIGNTLSQDILITSSRIEGFTPAFPGSISSGFGTTSVSVAIVNPDGETVIQEDFFSYVRTEPTSPRLLDVFPGALSGPGPQGAGVNTRIAFEFSQSMDASTLQAVVSSTTNFHGVEVLSDRNVIGGTLTWGPDSRVFVYDAQGNPFIPGKAVEIGFSSGLRSLDGGQFLTTDVIQIDSPFFSGPYLEDWAFVTGAGADTGALVVLEPTGAGSQAPATWTTELVFSKEIHPLTVFEEDVFLVESGTSHRILVDLKILSGGLRVKVDPRELLRPSHSYTLTWKKDRLRSLTNHELGSDFVHVLGSQDSGPRVLSLLPLDGTTTVSQNTVVIVGFDQPILEDSMNESNMALVDATGRKIPAVYSSESRGLFFTLKFLENLEGGKDYEIQVSRRVKSLTGIPLTQEKTSAFRVSDLDDIDLSGPVVVDVFPSNLQSGISTSATPTVTFSEAVHPSDLGTETLQLVHLVEGQELAVDYKLNFSPGSSTLSLTPLTGLEFEGSYQLLVAAGVRDLSDNRSLNSVSVSFQVTSRFDSLGPGIQSVFPLPGATGVKISTHVLIVFSEGILAADVNAQNFTLQTTQGVLVPVGLTQEDNGTTVRMIPTDPLLKQTDYRIQLTSGIHDTLGNPSTLPATFVFQTEFFVDEIAPIITNLTVNSIPALLNGDSGALQNNEGVFQAPELQVPENGFTLDIYYEDPGEGGETSGVDSSTISIVDEKVVFDQSTAQSLANLNLLVQGITPVHSPGHTRLTIPSFWSFAAGIHSLSATVKDLSAAGNISLVRNFSFRVIPVADEGLNYPFENGGTTRVSLEYDGDSFLYTASVQLGGLKLSTFFESDGAKDFEQEMQILGLASSSQDAAKISTLVKRLVLEEVRTFFDLDPVSGNPITNELPMGLRFENEINPTDTTVTRILIGGDNGAETGGAVIVSKSSELSVYNTANRIPFLDLTQRSSTRDQGLGVFSAQLIRFYANDPAGLSEWASRFGPVSLLSYTNTGAGPPGNPFGTFPDDDNVFLEDPSQLTGATLARYQDLRRAVATYARMIAVSVARVAAQAVGAVPKGFPPDGLYGGEQNLPTFFLPSESVHPYLAPVNTNNLMRKTIDFNSIFTAEPQNLKFSNFTSIYLRNQSRVSE